MGKDENIRVVWPDGPKGRYVVYRTPGRVHPAASSGAGAKSDVSSDISKFSTPSASPEPPSSKKEVTPEPEETPAADAEVPETEESREPTSRRKRRRHRTKESSRSAGKTTTSPHPRSDAAGSNKSKKVKLTTSPRSNKENVTTIMIQAAQTIHHPLGSNKEVSKRKVRRRNSPRKVRKPKIPVKLQQPQKTVAQETPAADADVPDSEESRPSKESSRSAGKTTSAPLPPSDNAGSNKSKQVTASPRSNKKNVTNLPESNNVLGGTLLVVKEVSKRKVRRRKVRKPKISVKLQQPQKTVTKNSTTMFRKPSSRKNSAPDRMKKLKRRRVPKKDKLTAKPALKPKASRSSRSKTSKPRVSKE